MSDEVRTELADGVAVVTLSSPRRRNAMNLDLAAKLVAAVRSVVGAPEARALVVTGEPPAFCAGGDLAELQRSDEPTLRALYAGFLEVAACPLPTIAAVNGPAVGAGLNLALACDVRLAGPTALFDARFMQIGLHPGGGYTWMVQRALGPQGAAALTLLGDALDAAEAERVGLVWRRYPDDDGLRAAALDLAGRAAAAPRDLLATTKATLRLTGAMATQAEATELELRAQAASIASPEFQRRVTELQERLRRR
ncbi:enoyl-CoA hydratase [Pseudonocardia sp. CNS-139]|nr:enoyl-CoA hydratase [Pseudonocardia sp. CNS-139]